MVALRLALRFALRFAVPHKPDLDDLWTFGDRDTRTWPPKISTKIKTFVGVVRDKLIASGNELVIAKKRLDSKSATNKSSLKRSKQGTLKNWRCARASNVGVLGQGLSRTSFSIVMTAKTSDEAVLEIRMGGFSPNVNVLQCTWVALIL